METEALSLSANSSLVKKAKMTKDFGPGHRDFRSRHLGSGPDQTQQMLNELGLKSLEELIDKTVPKSIRIKKPLALEKSVTEERLVEELKQMASKNKVFRSYIGLGYYGTLVPSVIQRNILENPGWYTQYTPYQAEISQGRLEALLNFQTMVRDLTAMEIANASLLDEATAAAEAVSMAFNLVGEDHKKTVFISDLCFPQTEAVVRTRAEALGLNVEVGSVETLKSSEKYFAVLVQYPSMSGSLSDLSGLADNVHKNKGLLIVAADLMALTLFTPPGEMGADIVVGSTQRFGVPFGFGGPHAAYLATRDEFKRQMPGRLVGVSVDSRGKRALRLALQTREQHIRRAKATSNICTAQVLLAIMAGMYAVYHGPQGLKQIASRIQFYTALLASGLRALGFKVLNGEKSALFDTIWVEVPNDKFKSILDLSNKAQINFNFNVAGKIGISLDETVSEKDLSDIWSVFSLGKPLNFKLEELAGKLSLEFGSLERKSSYLTHPVFNTYFTETEFLRYVTKLQNRDLSLATSMIPLGSCTMKLNATTEMVSVTWPEFSNIHPFAPKEQFAGYSALFDGLEKSLAEITGFDGVSLQPNAGSQGEYAGLLVIKKFLQSKGQGHRNICLIPNSAHGTNPATAVMVGFKVIGVECDAQGNISLDDLRKKSQEHSNSLAAIMVTYPSTHGVFEESIIEICDIIHKAGGQVYMDGANMNAQVGICRPGDFGPDVCHLNLHKTFCIPHGGGGPGMGPICVKSHLKPFLPGHPLVKVGGESAVGAVSAAPWGSPGILPIPYAYIRMMGSEGLKDSTILAILNANYIAKKLDPVFPVLFKGKNGFVAHECIIDLRDVKARSGIEVEDIAKRLMDYGFHAPTMSWPVIGTMMIEPTESESKAELDRFCDAMLSIAKEIKEVESGALDKLDNPLKNAPHTADSIASDSWNHKYSREKAAYPAPWLKDSKFWPFVGRIDNPYGDKNLVCACPPVESYS